MARVLVADDEEGCREILELSLGGQHEVRSAADGQAALEIASRWSPDVGILDVTLEGVSGIEVARQLHGHVLLIAFTGWSELPADAQSLFEAVLSKPATPDEIRRAVAEALEPTS